jgi:predicted RNA-binding Zn-ribbon protein involved in translation (DUF1610 family)
MNWEIDAGIVTMREAEFHSLDDMMIGICMSCGAERESCEPDASHYDCEECGMDEVYGVQELLLMGKIEFREGE